MHPLLRPLTDLQRLQNPLLIAGFAGPTGSGAAAAVGYLVEQWDATPVAEFAPDELYVFTGLRPMVLQNDGKRSLEWPTVNVHLARPEGTERDVLLVAGIEPHLRWSAFADAVASLMHETGTRDALLLGAYPAATPHTRALPLMLTASGSTVGERFGMEATVSRYQGPVDLRGVLDVQLGKNLDVGSLTALVPFYVANEQATRVIIALVEAVDQAVGSRTPLASLRRQAAMLDQHADEVVAASEELTGLVRSLEARFDSTQGALPQLMPAESLEETNEQLIAAVEEFLRGEPGASQPGSDGGMYPG